MFDHLHDPNEIMKYALNKIANDGYELSHEKIINQRDYFIKIAKEAIKRVEELNMTIIARTNMNDNF